ncbi:MAG TPA: peptide deformylase, partial [Bacillota bacterium]|nr:peptide deformylase [Bacillota bacterium]
ESGLIELINPEIIRAEGEQKAPEGCLSIPGQWGITRRPASVTVRALNRRGEPFEVTGTDLLARALCHETDHLDGRLFTDEGILIEMLGDEEE